MKALSITCTISQIPSIQAATVSFLTHFSVIGRHQSSTKNPADSSTLFQPAWTVLQTNKVLIQSEASSSSLPSDLAASALLEGWHEPTLDFRLTISPRHTLRSHAIRGGTQPVITRLVEQS